MVINFKNLLSRSSLPVLGLALNLSLTPAQAMEILDDAPVEKTSVHVMNNTLPNDVLLNIFSQLSVQELGRCTQACQNWKQVASNDDLWGLVAKREEHNVKFPLFSVDSIAYGSHQVHPSWKSLVKILYVQEKEIQINREESQRYQQRQRENMVQNFLRGRNNNALNEALELPPMHFYKNHGPTFSYDHINNLKNSEKRKECTFKNQNPELFKSGNYILSLFEGELSQADPSSDWGKLMAYAVEGRKKRIEANK